MYPERCSEPLPFESVFGKFFPGASSFGYYYLASALLAQVGLAEPLPGTKFNNPDYMVTEGHKMNVRIFGSELAETMRLRAEHDLEDLRNPDPGSLVCWTKEN